MELNVREEFRTAIQNHPAEAQHGGLREDWKEKKRVVFDERAVESFRYWFGLLILNRRQKIGISQQTLGAMTGMTRTSISSIEAGVYGTKLEPALHLCAALGIEMEEVVKIYRLEFSRGESCRVISNG